MKDNFRNMTSKVQLKPILEYIHLKKSATQVDFEANFNYSTEVSRYVLIALLKEGMIQPTKETNDIQDSEAYVWYTSPRRNIARLWKLTERGEKLRQLDMTLEAEDSELSKNIVTTNVLKKNGKVYN